MLDVMKENLGNPEVLEKMYRDDRKAFRAAFDKLFQDAAGSEALKFWKARLDYESRPDMLKALTVTEIAAVIVIGLIVALLIRIPALVSLPYSDDIYFMKNAAIIVSAGLVLYTFWFNRFTETRQLLIAGIAYLIPLVYVNLLPSTEAYSSVNLVFIHLPLLMWFIYGVVFTGFDFTDLGKRISFIRHNGDLAIIFALIAIAGGMLSAITIGLFDSIGMNIEEFYAENIIVSGAAAAPVVAAFITSKYPSLLNKTAPLIAGIFSPMVLLTLVIFLVTMTFSGKDPYNDRDFLLIFNVMLLGVMAIIIFSVSETSLTRNQKFNAAILFSLSLVAIIIDLIALSAIFYRLGEYGLTPNRLAVLVSNVLVLINLVLIMADLFRINFRKMEFRMVEMTTAKYLPVYLIWIVIVVFAFPLIFGLK